MNKRLLTVAAFALAGCVTIVAQDKKKEFKMPTGYAGITHEMSEFYEPVPPVVTPGSFRLGERKGRCRRMGCA